MARPVEPWRRSLKVDPVPMLLASVSEPIRFFARRDLLGERVGTARGLWEHPDALRILARQNDDGSWSRSGREKRSAVNVRLVETWRNFRFLVETYEFTREHPEARKAAEFLFSCQTRDGDIRGMLANQYATYYTGAILGLLLRAGYADDPRIERGFRWLLSMRQADGGWTIPILTRRLDRATLYRVTSRPAAPIEPDRSKPFSHHWTGMVLRAFAAHPKYRRSPEARTAAELLKSRFFQPDSYTSYRAANYWVRFEYPFWWNNLVSALDSLSLMRFSKEDPSIKRALDWLREHQEKAGLWKTSYVAGARENSRTRSMRPWITLAICRILRRFSPR